MTETSRKSKKIKAYKKLAEKMESKDYDSKRSNKLKRTYQYLNKKDREKGKIAEDMIDIAEVIKETGDPYLGELGMLKTKYKKRRDAEKAGAVSVRAAKGGEVKKYMGGGSVHNNKKQYGTQGYRAARKPK